MKKWKPERRDGLLLLGIGLGAAVGLLRGAVLAWLPVGVALGLTMTEKTCKIAGNSNG